MAEHHSESDYTQDCPQIVSGDILERAALFHEAPYGLAAMDATGRLRHCNKTLAAMSGKRPEELEGAPIQQCLSSEQHRLFFSAVERARESGRPQTVELDLQHDTLGEGRIFRLDVTAREAGPELEPYFLIGAMEVTASRRQEEELRQARRRAEAASHAKSEFLANMSHELRTPMHGVMSMLALLEDAGLEERQRKCLEMARSSASALHELINDILDLSRIEAGRLELRNEAFNPRSVVARVGELFAPMAEQRGVEFSLDLDDETPRALRGDPDRLRQVLFNLLNNALKHSPQGTISLTVQPLPEQPSNRAILRFLVEDSGADAPRERMEEAFNPFIQSPVPTEPTFARQVAGAGLGLTVVKRLVELMRGHLSMHTKKGEWNRVTLTLPFEVSTHATPHGLTPADAASQSASGGELSPQQTSSQGPPGAAPTDQTELAGLDVLLAEDNDINRRAAAMFLGGFGHQVTAVPGGAEALEALRERQYDVVLMDVQMPGMDGVEATRRIRAGEAGDPRTPIIALTAYVMDQEREAFLAAGMDAHIAKPVDYAALDALMRRLSERS